MNPEDLLKAAPEIAKGVGAIAAAIPFTAVVKRMLGPAADELAEMWRDQVRIYRYSRQVKLLEKVEKIAQEAGFTPQAVPPKILFPLLEGASFEDNEDLHDMWAALLANAASPENAEKVRPGFVAILKQMASDEAALLKWIQARSRGWEHDLTDLDWFRAEAELGFRNQAELGNRRRIHVRMIVCLDGLESQQLIRRNYLLPSSSSSLDEPRMRESVAVNFRLILTERGNTFIQACRPPKPKENG